jgi:SAM-dependent methyltransferase
MFLPVAFPALWPGRRRGPSSFRVLGGNRRAALLAGIEPATCRGLEFGPLTSPLVGRHEGPIEYVDHATAAELRRKYAADPHVDVTKIMEVDHVLDAGSLPASIPAAAYDYVIACHVFEHLPDPLGWLAQVAERMRPDGRLCLAVPDKRFTFDRLRPLARLADWVEPLVEGRCRPSPRSVFDAAMLSVSMPLAVTWTRPPKPEELRPQGAGQTPWVLSLVRQAAREYFDVHCSIVTPASCLGLLAEAAEADLHPFGLVGFGDTAPGAFEFFLQLVPAGGQPGPERARTFRAAAASAHRGSRHDPAAGS